MTARRLALALGTCLGGAGCNFLTGGYAYDPEAVPVLVERDEVDPAVDGGEGGPPDDGGSAAVDATDFDAQLPQGTKRVFVTSGYWMPQDIGGLAGADEHCRKAAAEAALGEGPWRAWMSTADGDARDRIEHHGAYALIDGTRVVSSWDELVSGNIQSPIIVTEKLTRVTGTLLDSPVWTGTNFAGTRASAKPEKTCGDFTSNAGEGVVGSCFMHRDGEWTNLREQVCGSWPARLYCFEQ